MSKQSSVKSTKTLKKEKDDKLIRYRCDYSSTPLRVLEARGWKRILNNYQDATWDIWWCDTSELKFALDASIRPHQRVSHFRNHSELTRKNYLYRNLKRYKRMLIKAGKVREAEFCDAMPTSFELPHEYWMLLEEHRKKHGTTWIVKPAAGSQGRGIFLFQRLKDLAEWRAKECTPTVSVSDTDPITYQASYVVQKYIENPYLLGGHKFDLRIYVLVTSFNPLKVWLAREGFARLSGEQFSLDKIDDNRVHLTNMAIQLKSKKHKHNIESLGRTIPANDDKPPWIKLGRKWALCSLRQYLTAHHGVAAVNELLQNIAGIIMASLQSVQSIIIHSRNSFELYGYDVILDELLKPWLLEVNASPSLNATSPEDFRLKFDLVDDVLNILDFERLLSGREIRVGGFDLLWNDAPVWACCSETGQEQKPRRLNIFLGAQNDREEQLQTLSSKLKVNRDYSRRPSAHGLKRR